MTTKRQRQPMPLDARRVLWERLWERLLRPLPDDAAAPEQPTSRPTPKGGE